MEHFKIKIGNNLVDASEYQDKIFNDVETGYGNMIISAAAGSSKTTTIVNCIDIINDNLKVLFVAFNKDIVENIKKKIGKHDNANVSTFHSIGYSILNENRITNSNTIVNEFKYKNYIKNNINNITSYKEIDSLKNNKKIYINNIINLIEYSRYYLYFSLKDIKTIAEQYGIIPIRDEVEVTREVLKWGKANVEVIDYTDMIWLPNVLNLNTYVYQYDWVLIDEAQDTSIAEQNLIFKCFKRGTRFIAVGDNSQKINMWCGASDEAIENFEKYPNTETYILPISYRCPKKIVSLAQQYSKNIIPKDNAIEGEINYNVSKFSPKNGDMVLCRTTAPLIELHLKYNEINKKSYVVGFENIRKDYIDLIQSANCTIIDRNLSEKNGLFSKLYTILLDEIKKVKDTIGIDDDDALSHQNVLKIYDSIEGIKAISYGLKNVDELIEKINIIFEGNEKDAIRLSTIHKAKGLEADNVFILYPSLLPSKMAKKKWEIETENNLIYVAYTRAKKTLNFIAEDRKKITNYGCFDSNAMKAELSIIAKKINYKEKNSIFENDISISNIENFLTKKENIKINKEKNINNKKAGNRLRNLLDE